MLIAAVEKYNAKAIGVEISPKVAARARTWIKKAGVQDQASVLESWEYPLAAWSAALTYEMIYEQPVVYELSEISRPTLLIIGQDDRTVVGKSHLPTNLQPVAGQYPELGRKAQAAISGSTLVEIPGCGHIPHIQKPDEFRKAVIAFLGRGASYR